MTKWWETAVASQLSVIKLTSEVRSASSIAAVRDLWLVFAINRDHNTRDAQNASSSGANYYFLCRVLCADKRWYDATLHTLAPSPVWVPIRASFAQQRGNIYCGTTRSAPLCDEEDTSALALSSGHRRGRRESRGKSVEQYSCEWNRKSHC